MIVSADRVVIDGDTGWWVVTEAEWLALPLDMEDPTVDLNRPCETCDGENEGGPNMMDPYGWKCPDCIDGRHTFDLSVACDSCPGDLDHPVTRCGRTSVTYRAAIIEVLPIVESPLTRRGYVPNRVESTDLPSAAAPGMYAVRLAIRS